MLGGYSEYQAGLSLTASHAQEVLLVAASMDYCVIRNTIRSTGDAAFCPISSIRTPTKAAIVVADSHRFSKVPSSSGVWPAIDLPLPSSTCWDVLHDKYLQDYKSPCLQEPKVASVSNLPSDDVFVVNLAPDMRLFSRLDGVFFPSF